MTSEIFYRHTGGCSKKKRKASKEGPVTKKKTISSDLRFFFLQTLLIPHQQRKVLTLGDLDALLKLKEKIGKKEVNSLLEF